jgi:hypothetical protein
MADAYPVDRTRVFVFGSNIAGRHGAGAAKFALKNYGAQYGRGEGRQGDSYAIPTKDRNLSTLTIVEIQPYVTTFIEYAENNPSTRFNVTAVGTGLAGHRHEDMARLFAGAPANCDLPVEWAPYLT